MTEPAALSLDERYSRFAFAVVTGLVCLGLAVMYSRMLRAAAEVEWLEQIPVLDDDPR